MEVFSFFIQLFLRAWRALCNGRSFLPVGAVLWGSWPVALWMISFKQVQYIPSSWRPSIHVDLLPGWNKALVSPWTVLVLSVAVAPACQCLLRQAKAVAGQKPTNWASKMQLAAVVLFLYPATLALLDRLADVSISVPKDVFAFVFYGVLHFAAPFIAGFLFWFFAPPGVAATYGWSLGFQNCAALATHILFPTAAPWYADLGNPPASYEHSLGNPAGLIRIDEIFGINLYHKAFKMSPVVFGALPSVHASSAVCFALYASRYFDNISTGVSIFYACTMLWSTMYLRHHYAIDLFAGSIYALAFFLLFRQTALQKIDARTESQGLTNGWERLVHGLGSTKGDILPMAQYHPLTPIPEEDSCLESPTKE